MAQVPYSPVPSVGPSQTATPNVRVDTPSAAFGGTVGQALEHLGKVESHVGDEIFQRAMALQALRNETEAKEADAKYMIESGKLHAEFNALQGKAAVEAYPKYVSDLQVMRQKIRHEMSNEMAMKMYDGVSLSFMGRNIFNGAGVAASQMKQEANRASVARQDLLLQQISTMPMDDLTFERASRGIQGEADAQAQLGGWSPEVTEASKLKMESKSWAHRITGLSRTQPFEAEKMLEKVRDKIHWADLEKVENTVRTQLRTTGARNIDLEVNADLREESDERIPEKTLEQRLTEGRKKAEELAPNDELLPDFVADRIRSTYNKSKTERRDADFRNKETVNEGLNGGQGKVIPTTVEELRALSPAVDAAYDSLPEREKRRVNGILAKNAQKDFPKSEENFARLQYLKGMAQTDPAAFTDHDIMSENIPREWRGQLMLMQRKAKENSATDPRVTRALRILSPTLLAAGLKMTKDDDDYRQFVGTLQDALEQHQTDTKKQPDYKQVQEIGSRLLQEQKGTGWLGTDVQRQRLYQLPVPSDKAEAIKADPAWKQLGIEPTPEQIRRVYVLTKYKELYGGKTPTPGPNAPAPEAPKSQ